MTYKEFRQMRPDEVADEIREQLGREAWYDYVAALRGPDAEAGALSQFKILFTSFLRGAVLNIHNVYVWEHFMQSSSYFNVQTLVGLVETKDWKHYLSHVKVGLEALQRVMESRIPAGLLAIAESLENGNTMGVSDGLKHIGLLPKKEGKKGV